MLEKPERRDSETMIITVASVGLTFRLYVAVLSSRFPSKWPAATVSHKVSYFLKVVSDNIVQPGLRFILKLAFLLAPLSRKT